MLLAGAMLAVLFAGCGGGNSTESASTTIAAEGDAPLTKVEFIAKGDAICEVGNQSSTTEIENFAKKHGFAGEPSKAQAEEVVSEVLVPNLERQADELSALNPPAGDEKEVEKIIASLEQQTSKIKQDPQSFFEGNVLEDPSRLEKAYGFKVCG